MLFMSGGGGPGALAGSGFAGCGGGDGGGWRPPWFPAAPTLYPWAFPVLQPEQERTKKRKDDDSDSDDGVPAGLMRIKSADGTLQVLDNAKNRRLARRMTDRADVATMMALQHQSMACQMQRQQEQLFELTQAVAQVMTVLGSGAGAGSSTPTTADATATATTPPAATPPAATVSASTTTEPCSAAPVSAATCHILSQGVGRTTRRLCRTRTRSSPRCTGATSGRPSTSSAWLCAACPTRLCRCDSAHNSATPSDKGLGV